MSMLRGCCECACGVHDCLLGDTTNEGCCHNADSLLLWCERPGHSLTQSFYFGSGGPGGPSCQTHFRIDAPSEGPTQAIYDFYQCFWRCVIPPPNTGPLGLYVLGARCADPNCVPVGSPYLNCCSNLFPTGCLCGDTNLSPFRKANLLANDASKWVAELECHKGGAALNGANPALRFSFLCVVHFERWWKIADCVNDAEFVVPGAPAPYITSQMVPGTWIYACSGVPFFQWELDRALTDGVISGGEWAEFLNAIANGQQPPQPILTKLGDAGYFDTKDYRETQQTAFIELNAYFPSAGYAACVQDITTMALLGPVRKQLTAPAPQLRPVLDAADVDTTAVALQAGCQLNYPGSLASQTDYDYWAARQYTYMRAVPGGWSWACSGVNDGAVLNGARNGDTCIAALKSEPRTTPTCTSLSPVDTAPGAPPFCNNCTGGCVACGSSLALGCTFFSPTPVATFCSNLVVSPICQGIRFVYAQYATRNTIGVNPPVYVCLFSSKSYLVEAHRGANDWTGSVPYACRETNLGVFNAWPTVAYGHYSIAPICDDLLLNQGVYTIADMCCSGYCWDFSPGNDPGSECFVAQSSTYTSPCAATTECPPHSSANQISCIGFTPDCDVS